MGTGLWRCADADVDRVARVAAAYGLPSRVARWLCSRALTDGDISLLMNPKGHPYTDAYAFSDMRTAVREILQAVHDGKRIGIIGDYDVDGVTSSAILATALSALGGEWVCLIPHRVEDGYGLSTNLVNRAIDAGCELLVTVDNGIRANDAVAYALARGLSTVVTDHHEPGDELPVGAAAIVHWARGDDASLRVLSGAGVAWKLATALADSVLNTETREWLKGLAALGALADVMPMKGENRRLVWEGIAALQTVERTGWRKLCGIAGVKQSGLSETEVLWSITPRLNAAGRMGDAKVAFQLLMAVDDASAESMANDLEALNVLRRKETERATLEATAAVEAERTSGGLPPVVVVAGNWPLGVVGIVAAKLCDAYGRPAIVFADEGNHLLRGSGRASEGVPLHSWVTASASWLEHFGGHETALGCGVLRDKFSAFREALYAAARVEPENPVERRTEYVADDYLPLSDATLEAAQWLAKLGPYGNGFNPFQFYVGPVEVVEVTPMGNGRHLRLTAREGRETSTLIWFSAPDYAFSLKRGSLLSAVVSLEVNVWKDTERAQLRIQSAYALEAPLVREDFAVVYRVLKARRKVYADEVAHQLPAWDAERVRTVFDTFVDLGFAYRAESAYHVVEQAKARDLRESLVYQEHLRVLTEPTAG